ncbi:MAG: TonB-dependent receptor, partial [Bacteroidetes bacterium]|nr:TonB-dependent receptor [Bacteroidota bacterium]
QRLVISYAGYQSDTIAATPAEEIKVVLASGKQLKEVRVTARQRSTYLSLLSPIRTQVMTDRELFKAACCNLSESFEINPSVDVSYNDAVTGSKQIQLLGLSGIYTQLTVENLPGPRGIATALGLNSIAGPWVESIQLTKGIGSVANGFESIAGQINVELKKPENSEQLFANAYINQQGKSDINLNLSHKLGKKWAVGLLLHDDFLKNKMDFNKDGFRDLPTGNQFSAINRWKFDNGNGWMGQFGIKTLLDNRTGGQVQFDPANDKLTTHYYGLGINTKRFEEFAKIGYVFPQKKYKSIGLQLSSFQHKQDSYFGLTTYNANQQNFYTNLLYQSIIGTTQHKFRTGISFVLDNYNEIFQSVNYQRRETVPGVFFEYTYSSPDTKFGAVAGIRADHNNLYGSFVTPRLHLRYEPVKGTTIRMSAGRGQRTANIFAENLGVLISARQVNIISTSNNKAYGLQPEIAWNEGISVDQKFKLNHHDGTFSVDFFRTDFQNQVVVDVDKSAREVDFYNLQGRSYSNSFQAELNYELFTKFDLRLAYRLFDVKTNYHNELLQRPLVAKNRAFANLAWEHKGWKFDYTISYTGTKRLPYTKDNPAMYQLHEYSPSFITMNAQVSKTVGNKHPLDLYIGGENLTNYFQPNPVIAADDPFSNYFDASIVWGPLAGRMLYAGLRYKIK